MVGPFPQVFNVTEVWLRQIGRGLLPGGKGQALTVKPPRQAGVVIHIENPFHIHQIHGLIYMGKARGR